MRNSPSWMQVYTHTYVDPVYGKEELDIFILSLVTVAPSHSSLLCILYSHSFYVLPEPRSSYKPLFQLCAFTHDITSIYSRLDPSKIAWPIDKNSRIITRLIVCKLRFIMRSSAINIHVEVLEMEVGVEHGSRSLCRNPFRRVTIMSHRHYVALSCWWYLG